MTTVEYPILFNEFSDCADANQKKHFQILRIRIALLIAIAVLGALVWKQIPELKIIPPVAIATSLSFMFVVTVLIENKKCDVTWHTGRDIAETIKRESLLYMMKIKPYEDSDQSSKARFLEYLKKTLNSQIFPWGELTHNQEGEQIPESMDRNRNLSFEDRKQFYIQNRINDQLKWYTKKASVAAKRVSQMSILVWALLALGVALSFVNVVSSAMSIDLPINAVGIATTASAALLSWIGARSYSELSKSYSVIAHELSLIRECAKSISTDDQLVTVVEESEGLMGSEHNLWKVKRQIS